MGFFDSCQIFLRKCITNKILIVDLISSLWYTIATNKENDDMFLLKNTIKGETYLYFAVQKREGKKTRPIRVKSLGRLSDLLKKDPDIIVHLKKQLDEINGSPEKTESVIYSSLRPREKHHLLWKPHRPFRAAEAGNTRVLFAHQDKVRVRCRKNKCRPDL